MKAKSEMGKQAADGSEQKHEGVFRAFGRGIGCCCLVLGIGMMLPIPTALAQLQSPEWEVALTSEPETGFVQRKSSPAVGPEGTIYVGVTYDTRDGVTTGRVVAVNPDGTVKWQFPTFGPVDTDPAVADDGTIYVATENGRGLINGEHQSQANLYAVQPSGSLRWKVKNRVGFHSPAIGPDGTVYLLDRGRSDLAAYSPEGEEQWRLELPEAGTAAPVVAGETVYSGTEAGLVAVSTDGELQWAFSTEGPVAARGAVDATGTIYFGVDMPHVAPLASKVYAVHPDGSKKWQFRLEADDLQASPIVGGDGTVYLASQERRLYGINADGTERWHFDADGILASAPVIDQEGRLIFGSWDGVLHLLTQEGELEARWQTDLPISSSPALTEGGGLYFGVGNQRLVSFEHDSGLAHTPWPMAGHGIRRTGGVPAAESTGEEDRPRIVKHPDDQVADTNGQVEFEVTAEGSGTLQYQWRKENQILEGETEAVLTIDKATISDVGGYWAVVKNDNGMVASKEARLQVDHQPETETSPLKLSGWNLDIVFENVAPDKSHAFSFQVFLGSEQLKQDSYSAWFESGLKGREDGLPGARRLVSAVDEDVVFEPAPYNQENALVLASLKSHLSGTLTLDESGRYRSLFILAASDSGGGYGELTLHFQDGTESAPLSFFAADWFFETEKTAVAKLGTLRRRSGELTSGDGRGHLHQTGISLAALGVEDKILTGMTFTKPGGFDRPSSTFIMAVSGVPTDPGRRVELESPERTSEGKLRWSVSGARDHAVRIEHSPDLEEWQRVMVLEEGESNRRFLVPEATSNGKQFYRAVVVE